MNGAQAERIKEIVEQSDSFGLFMDEGNEEHILLARKALKAILQNEGKTVFQFPETPEHFKGKWSSILPAIEENPITHSTLLHIPKKRFNIKGISYEDTDDFFTINIDAENNLLQREDIVFESRPAQIDAALCFFDDPESLESAVQNISLPPKEKIIFINPSNGTLAGKIYDIARAIDENSVSRNNVSSLLLASLLLERVKTYRQSRDKTWQTEQDLLQSGADKKIVGEIISEFLSLDNLPII